MRLKNVILLAVVLSVSPMSYAKKAEKKRKPDALQQVVLSGTVERGIFGAGTRSESEALLLKMADGSSLKLRSKGANPFEIDESLVTFVGKRVTCKGFVNSDVLLNAECERN